MLSSKSEDVAINPIKVDMSENIEKVKRLLKRKLPIFSIGKTVTVINRTQLEKAGLRTKLTRISKKIKPLDASTPIFKVARLMLEKSVEDYPIKTQKSIKAITSEIVVSAVKVTSELSKREAKTIMSPCKVVSESRVQNASDLFSRLHQDVIPVVNASGKLIGTWREGKVSKKPLLARPGTRVKLLIGKIEKGPIVVVDKQRIPVGVVTKTELLELAASYREYTVPIFYSGLESLGKMNVEALKEMVLEAINKVNKVTPAQYASVNVGKKGVWTVRIKLSTPLRMFLSQGESQRFKTALSESLEHLVSEVINEKKKRLKFRNLGKE